MEKDTNYCKVMAYIRCEDLERVVKRLQELGVSDISVTHAKGYGDHYPDFYSRDCMGTHDRVEVFTAAERAELVSRAIIDAAHSGVVGDGIVAVLPVSKVYRIQKRMEIPPDEL